MSETGSSPSILIRLSSCSISCTHIVIGCEGPNGWRETRGVKELKALFRFYTRTGLTSSSSVRLDLARVCHVQLSLSLLVTEDFLLLVVPKH